MLLPHTLNHEPSYLWPSEYLGSQACATTPNLLVDYDGSLVNFLPGLALTAIFPTSIS
jgi:hypothetical protein